MALPSTTYRTVRSLLEVRNVSSAGLVLMLVMASVWPRNFLRTLLSYIDKYWTEFLWLDGNSGEPFPASRTQWSWWLSRFVGVRMVKEETRYWIWMWEMGRLVIGTRCKLVSVLCIVGGVSFASYSRAWNEANTLTFTFDSRLVRFSCLRVD